MEDTELVMPSDVQYQLITEMEPRGSRDFYLKYRLGIFFFGPLEGHTYYQKGNNQFKY